MQCKNIMTPLASLRFSWVYLRQKKNQDDVRQQKLAQNNFSVLP